MGPRTAKEQAALSRIPTGELKSHNYGTKKTGVGREESEDRSQETEVLSSVSFSSHSASQSLPTG